MNTNRLSYAAQIAILTILSVFVMSSAGWAATYYVDATNGNDNNSGTLTKPFLTINKAATGAIAGDKVYVRKGTYKERLAPQHSGSPGEYITFQNYQNEKVVIDATGRRQGIMLWNDSYIKIIGFEVINSTNMGIHVHHHMDSVDRGSDYNIIKDNKVHNCGTDGYSGIYIGGHGNAVLNNYAYENGGGIKDHGIYILGNNNLVEGNNVHSNTRNGIRMEGENNIIKANVIYDNPEWGISIWVDDPLKAENISLQQNLIYNNTYGGIAVRGSGSGGKPNRIYIYNNTIVNATGKNGLYVIDGVKNIKIKNNIFKGQYSQGVIATDSQSVEGYEEDYNIFYGSGAFRYNSVVYSSLEEYRIASSWSANSMNMDPMLDNDYHLNKGSIAIDKGTDIGISFAGVAPDIGAFESESSSLIAPPQNLRLN